MKFSIVDYVDVLETQTSRIDAEFFKPEYIKIYRSFEENKGITKRLSNYTVSITASAFYPSIAEYYSDKGVPFVRVADVKDLSINHCGLVKLNQEILDRCPTIKKGRSGDIIITKGGTVANLALLSKEYEEYALCRDIICIKTSKLKEEMQIYLLLYLNSKYGKMQLMRFASQSLQPHLTLPSIRDLIVIPIERECTEIISSIYKKFIYLKKEANSQYIEAENLLLSELGFTYWKPIHKLSFVKNYSDTEKVGRVDAEYFHPEYHKIISLVKGYCSGYDFFENLIDFNTHNFTPDTKKNYRYVELSNVSTREGEILDYTEDLGGNLPTRARRKVKTGDVIVSSIEGSLSSIALITEELNGAVCSTGFYVINSDFFNSETLLCLMKSLIGQEQLKRGCSGTILTAINREEVSKIILPKIRLEIQEKIKKRVLDSYRLRKKSKKLLDVAKKGVELAIEQDEKTARQWMQGETEKLGTTK